MQVTPGSGWPGKPVPRETPIRPLSTRTGVGLARDTFESTDPALTRPPWNCVWGPRWGFWGYLKVPQCCEYPGIKCFTRDRAASPWCSWSPSLASWSFEACHTAPRLSQAHRTQQSCLTVEQADKRQVLLTGLGSGSHSVIHPTNVQEPTVPVTVLSTGDSEFRKNHTLCSQCCLSPPQGGGLWALRGGFLSLCAHAHWA